MRRAKTKNPEDMFGSLLNDDDDEEYNRRHETASNTRAGTQRGQGGGGGASGSGSASMELDSGSNSLVSFPAFSERCCSATKC